jgi:hypothetical protein
MAVQPKIHADLLQETDVMDILKLNKSGAAAESKPRPSRHSLATADRGDRY